MTRSALMLVASLAVFACGKRYQDGPKKLGEACVVKPDNECDWPLRCVPGIRDTPICAKTCGPTSGQAMAGIGSEADTSCPDGWECSGYLERRLKDRETGADKGSAYVGMGDQPLCVPKGWTPPTERRSP